MKILFYIFLILLVPSVCLASIDTNSVNAIGETPSGDAVDGALKETMTAQGNYIDIINGNVAAMVRLDEILATGNYVDIVNGVGTIARVTDSTLLIADTPAGDAVDGAWVEIITAQGNHIDIINGNFELIETWFVAQGNYLDIVNNNVGTVKWQSGIEYATGAEWWNDQFVCIQEPTPNALPIIIINMQ